MTPHELERVVRSLGIYTGALLIVVLLVAMVVTWRDTRPSGKLFGLGMLAYLGYGVQVSAVALGQKGVQLYWYSYIPPIANLWLTGAIIILTFEKRQEALRTAEAVIKESR